LSQHIFLSLARDQSQGYGISYLQVLQDLLEQLVQLADEELRRELAPPIPKEEKSFWISLLLQARQETSFSPPIRTRASK
jgi:hypothetical protein